MEQIRSLWLISPVFRLFLSSLAWCYNRFTFKTSSNTWTSRRCPFFRAVPKRHILSPSAVLLLQRPRISRRKTLHLRFKSPTDRLQVRFLWLATPDDEDEGDARWSRRPDVVVSRLVAVEARRQQRAARRRAAPCRSGGDTTPSQSSCFLFFSHRDMKLSVFTQTLFIFTSIIIYLMS